MSILKSYLNYLQEDLKTKALYGAAATTAMGTGLLLRHARSLERLKERCATTVCKRYADQFKRVEEWGKKRGTDVWGMPEYYIPYEKYEKCLKVCVAKLRSANSGKD